MLEYRGRVTTPDGTCTRTVTRMTVQRLPRGTRVNPTRAAWIISGDRKTRFEEIARTVGVSSGVLLEQTIDHLIDELSEDGVPSWWSSPTPDESELPIDTA